MYCLQEPVISAATLIVTPASICQQWVDEITKHVKDGVLKVMVCTVYYV